MFIDEVEVPWFRSKAYDHSEVHVGTNKSISKCLDEADSVDHKYDSGTTRFPPTEYIIKTLQHFILGKEGQ